MACADLLLSARPPTCLPAFLPAYQAKALLQKNFENATSSLAAIDSDLHFLRDQINTTEVCRCHTAHHQCSSARMEDAQLSTSFIAEF